MTAGLNWEGATLSKLSQMPMDTCCMISLMCSLQGLSSQEQKGEWSPQAGGWAGREGWSQGTELQDAG